jgi:glycosyltransferase involved in cell wall biosynthesis
MKKHKNKVAIVIYANPDYYPPVIGAISLLARDLDVIVICRNQENPERAYPDNVTILRLGKLKTAGEKESQGLLVKIAEYASFIFLAVFYVRSRACRLVYAFDMHGLFAGVVAARFGSRRPVVYHNLDLVDAGQSKGLSALVKKLELISARFADKVIFPDKYRAEIFKGHAGLKNMPDIVMNTPLSVINLPKENKLLPLLAARGIEADAKVLLIQGSIGIVNCVRCVVEVMAFLPKDAVLVLLGFSTEEFISDIYRLAGSLHVDNRVIYIPRVPYHKLFAYTVGSYLGIALYKAVDVNRLYNAGASNKLFEYLSLGIPVVTNDTPEFRQIADERVAYFADPDSAKSIAAAITLALSDRDGYSRRAQTARAMHLDCLNFEEQFKGAREFIINKISKGGS